MLENFIQLVSEESIKSQQIEAEKQRVQKEKDKMFRIETTKSLGDFFAVISEARSVPQIMEDPKVFEEFDFFPKKLYERITLPNPPADLEKEADKLKTIIANRTLDDEQSINDHDEHAFYAIDMYCKKHGLGFHDNEMEDIVQQAKPTIKYFKEMFNVSRPQRIDPSIKPMSSTTSNTPAYPSGHACQSMLVGLYVSAKFPKHEEGIIEAAKECGMGRVKAGFHYLADYVAGNLLAEKMFLVMNKDDYGDYLNEAPRIPRKKGQPAGSDKHSDLYTDENPKGTIHGLGFKDVETARASVSKIKNSGKTHAHKIQAAVAMEQRAKEMGKREEAAVYRTYIEQMKKKTKEMQNEEVILREDNSERVDILKTFFNKLDDFEKTLEEKTTASAGHIYADHMTNHLPKKKELNEIENIRREFNHFREMVSRQMSTIGGGGAVNLLDLDDIDTSSLGNGKFLVFNSTSGKLEFTDQVDGN
jgi:hypothetical protein